jgi:hypothetical protein
VAFSVIRLFILHHAGGEALAEELNKLASGLVHFMARRILERLERLARAEMTR